MPLLESDTGNFNRSAKYFDHIYASRDYDGWAKHYTHYLGDGRLVEFGCGTGEMLRRFPHTSKIGIEPCLEMAEISRGKGLDVRIGSIASANVECDTACAVWSTLGYSAAQVGIFDTLAAVRQMIPRGGRFCFDVTHTAAIASQELWSGVESEFDTPIGKLKRTSYKQFDWKTGILRVAFLYQSGSITWREIHLMQCFTVPEIEFALQRCGFKMRRACRCPDAQSGAGGHADLTAEITENVWEFFVCAEAV